MGFNYGKATESGRFPKPGFPKMGFNHNFLRSILLLANLSEVRPLKMVYSSHFSETLMSQTIAPVKHDSIYGGHKPT